ncbi:MAG: AbrB/MazE/SpoVT family DNA-binding domain-containing protein, partial [Ruminococcus sp.]|nr:AbrB/MazE/SpoVT family DNA-binding domain-containing protein [Ruminococcus sp.]
MVKFKKLSKSRGVTIPKDIAAHLDFEAGMAVDLTAADGNLIISKHVNACRFCGGADNVKRFGDVYTCPVCAAR